MKTPIKFFAAALIFFAASCSTTSDEAIVPTDTSSPDILQELTQSQWKIAGCPANQFLTINGHSECEYLDFLKFDGANVYITHKDASYVMPHHICFVYGERLVVSIQECSNTTWRSLFEWSIVSLDNNMLVMDITAPNLNAGYNQRFTFARQN